MVAWAFSDVLQPIISQLVSWFNLIVNKLAAGNVIIAAVAIVMTVSFLIMPLRGTGMGNAFSGASDYASKVKKNSDKRKASKES